jgi:hypothetical protein
VSVDRYSFDGLEAFSKRIRRVAKDVGYLVVFDRTNRHQEDTLGRFELCLRDAYPYLEDATELRDDAEDEDDESLGIEDGDPDDEAPEEDADDDDGADVPEEKLATRAERLLGRTPGAADFAVAAMRWIEDIATRNMGGDEVRRFRVRAYAPKGARTVETASFTVTDEEADSAAAVAGTTSLATTQDALPDVTDLRIPPPSFENVEAAATVKGMRALGDYYAQWGKIVLGSVGQLQGLNNTMLARMHKQLQESRGQVDELVGAILTNRVAEAELAEQRRSSDRTEDARTLLAQQALQQVGDAAKAFLAARGVTPELADALGAIGQSPELVQTLNDPDVRVLMHDPANLSVLAAMLKQAAGQARTMREQAAKAA